MNHHPARQRAFSAASSAASTNVTSTLPTPATAPSSSQFKTFAKMPYGIVSKPRPLVRKSVILLTTVLALFFFVAAQFTSLPVFVRDSHSELLRYSNAGSHFRKDLPPDQLEAYYKKREAALNAAAAAVLTDDKDVVQADDVVSPYFRTCIVSTETSALHPSLKRGADAVEIENRALAKQPRDFDDVFAVVDHKRHLFHPDRPAVQTLDWLAGGLDTDFNDAVKVSRAVIENDIHAKISEETVPVAYLRTTRTDGWQAIINLGAVYNKTVAGVEKKSNVRRLVAVTRGYGRPCEVHFIRPREMVRINVVVAYSQRPHRLHAFLKMFAHYLVTYSSDVLRIVISTTKEEHANVIKVSKEFPELSKDRFSVISTPGDELGNFSRAVALREAVKLVPPDEVMFFSDADLTITGNFLQNCRVNVVRGFQVWFPVMFSLYPYGHGLSSRDGIWRRSSYGMVCMYQSDFQAVGGFGGKEETQFTGWGSEDVFLYNSFRDSDEYAVLRTLEPGLRHHWHGKDCEHNEHYENCMRTVYMTIGSQDAIAKLMVDAKVDVSNLTKDAMPV